MAVHWRIRHKLMLGLGLVVCIIALLLAGTVFGMLAARDTMKALDSKVNELREAQRVKESVADIKLPPGSEDNILDQSNHLRDCLADVGEAVSRYEARLNETVSHHWEFDATHKQDLITALRERTERLRAATAEAAKPGAIQNGGARPLLEDDAVRPAHEALTEAARELHDSIYEDLYKRMNVAKKDYTRSLWFETVFCVVGVALLVVLVRLLYRWVAGPIHRLQQGVDRVARGNFEGRIEVHTGDEMEQLAAAFNDMTGRLSEMYRDLARQVNERSRQLVRSERLASVGFLAAGVAHEINNPLASIAFCSEALESRLQALTRACPGSTGTPANTPGVTAGDQETIVRYLKMIQEEAFRCKEITSRLLEFSRGGERKREPTDLVDLVQSVLDMVQHLQNGKGKSIVFRPAGRSTAWVNAQEMKSVVLNLVVNALDSMDEGGTLTIGLGQKDGQAELVFADTGCGMTDEVLENIFEPFFTRSRTGKGTGLGLSISHRVLTQHGGEIEASSPGPDRGSTFVVRVPLQPGGRAEPSGGERDDPAGLAGQAA